jgi:hypothetical protein
MNGIRLSYFPGVMQSRVVRRAGWRRFASRVCVRWVVLCFWGSGSRSGLGSLSRNLSIGEANDRKKRRIPPKTQYRESLLHATAFDGIHLTPLPGKIRRICVYILLRARPWTYCATSCGTWLWVDQLVRLVVVGAGKSRSKPFSARVVRTRTRDTKEFVGTHFNDILF